MSRCRFWSPDHKLDGPENDGRILCSRCGEVFDAEQVRTMVDAGVLPAGTIAGRVDNPLADPDPVDYLRLITNLRLGDRVPSYAGTDGDQAILWALARAVVRLDDARRAGDADA